MDAVVLAAGKGTRLLPLTATRPKPLVPFLNRPLMDYMMAHLHELGVDRAFVLVDYLGDQIKEYYTKQDGIELVFSGNNDPLGTAGAVKKVAKEIHDTFLVVSGDVLTNLNFKGFLDFHLKTGGTATMALSRVDDPRQYGIAVLDGDGRITRFLEKPKPEEVFSNFVNAGIYIFEPRAFDPVPEGKNFDFSKDLFPTMLAKGIPVYGYPFDEYWNDIGRPTNYLAATGDTITGKYNNDLVPPMKTSRTGGALLVGENCTVGDSVEVHNFAILGDNVEVGEGTKLNACVIFANSTLGRECRVGESIVGADAILEDQVQVKAGSVIGDACYIKRGATLGYNTRLWYASRLEADSAFNPE